MPALAAGGPVGAHAPASKISSSGALMIGLRAYQLEVIEQIEQAIAAGQRRILVTLPTGAGKTVCAADIIRRFNERGLFSLFLAHRREIIRQTSQRLTEHGMPLGAHGIIMAERMCDLRPQARIQAPRSTRCTPAACAPR